MEHLDIENREDTTSQTNVHQRILGESSYPEVQERQVLHPQPSEICFPHLNGNIELNNEDGNSASIDRVPKTPQHENLVQMNLDDACGMENVGNSNVSIQFDLQRFQMQFRSQLDSFKTPKMCYC